MRYITCTLALLLLAPLTGCSTSSAESAPERRDTPTATSQSRGDDRGDEEHDQDDDAHDLAVAAQDAVEAVGRGAVIRGSWDGSTWDLVVANHAGDEWDVRGLPSDEPRVASRDVTPAEAQVSGRVRTVLDDAPTLDDRVEDLVDALGSDSLRSVRLVERDGTTVWSVEGTDGATAEVPAEP